MKRIKEVDYEKEMNRVKGWEVLTMVGFMALIAFTAIF